ncbi:MAG: hypothetical protein KGJ02_07725 [Verrucomicrobiota bacterium]|nr:hypothetical protein [Verrucomicrobiota bacterium]
MNISNHDFHDGYIIDVQHRNNRLEISMESAQISDDELNDDIVLSNHHTIKGKLHLEEVESIKINNKENLETITKKYDEGIIHSFDIKENKLTLVLSWVNHTPNVYEETDFFKYEIEAKKIWWETIADLYNPFWQE